MVESIKEVGEWPRVMMHLGFVICAATHYTQANATVRVRNPAGHVVRRKALGTLEAGTHSWKWGGRNGSGHLVKPGRFTITFSARAHGITDAGRPRAVHA
jgi:hypothetical protein